MLPNLNGLKAFEASGITLNFHTAANKLGVTQGAVAQQVRALEAQLGVKLFERQSKGLAFTAVGRSFHARVSAAFETIRQSTSEILPEQNKVTISVTPTFAAKWLIPNLGEFSANNADIDIRVLATESISSFQKDGIDLAVRQGKVVSNASIESHMLFRNEIVAVAAPQLVAKNKLPLSAQEIALLTKLHDGHNHWPEFLSLLNVKNQSGREIRLNQTALAIDAAIGGHGVALASRFLVERNLNEGNLVIISDAILTGKSDFHLLSRRIPYRTPSVQNVMEWLISRTNLIDAGDHSE